MGHPSFEIAALIAKHLREETSAEEMALLDAWQQKSPANKQFLEEMADTGKLNRYLVQFSQIDPIAASGRLNVKIEEGNGYHLAAADLKSAAGSFPDSYISIAPAHRIHFLKTTWFRYAAAVILVFGVAAAIVVSSHRPSKNSKNTLAYTSEILPGKDGAILTLADGSQVSLDSIPDGVVALQGGATAKVVNGSLLYESNGNEVVYNTMSTPKGRQFHVTLPDGTQVWLNAASSIRYPTVFTGKERKVEVNGEAYFEVAKNKAKPFLVDIDGKSTVEVLGTSFNVNAYDNEASISTTLIEGSVSVFVGQKTQQGMEKQRTAITLKPGQQSQIAVALVTGKASESTSPGSDRQPSSSPIKVINNANIDKVMAWKNGLFNFEDASLQEVMRQLERWYNIEVIYESRVPNMELMGKMTKGVTLNGLLIGLEKLGVHYRLEGRRLIMLP